MKVKIFFPHSKQQPSLELQLDVLPNKDDQITIKDKTYHVFHRNFHYNQYKHLQYWDLYLGDTPSRI